MWIMRSCIVLLCAIVVLRAVADEPRIWERPIAAQPFDREPFRQVAIPDWVRELVGCGYTLSMMDTAARQEAARHGVAISELGFVNPFFACYDSKLIAGRSPDYPPGRLERDIAEYKRLGVRILAVYPPCLQGEVYQKHPLWRRIATNTTEIPAVDMQKHPHGGMLCLLGPYGDFMIEVLAEILTRFPQVDAFSFDGLHYGGVCYCQSCREHYRADTGCEVPDADLNNVAFRRYQHWADRRLERLVQRMQQRLKRIKPQVALITWTTNAGRFGHLLSIPRNMPARMNLLFDAPDQELWLDETNRGLTVVPSFANAYAWATTNHRVAFSEPYLLSHGNPYGHDSFPPEEILRRMLLAVTYGTQPSIAVAQPPRLQHRLYACMGEIQRRRPWLTHKRPQPWAALVMSDNTRNFYGRSAGLVEDRYLASVLGTFRAAMETHLPVTIINDWNLNASDLAEYKVLLLPNTACLDDLQVTAVREFVQRGGGLVASLDVSLFDEFGEPRDNFALADVLGVDYRGLPEPQEVDGQLDVNFATAIGPDYWEKRKSVFDLQVAAGSILNSGRLATYVGTDPVTFKGPAVRVQLRENTAFPLATIQPRSVPESPRWEGIVSRQHGRGRVVYLSAGLDAAYYLYPYPYQRLVLEQATRWAASAPPPVEITAPMCVQTTVMRQQRDGERLVIHLFNDLNTTVAHALPNDDVPLREETVPIHDIVVRFSAELPIRSVRLQPEDTELEMSQSGDSRSVVVPRLDIHSMLVVELDGP